MMRQDDIERLRAEVRRLRIACTLVGAVLLCGLAASFQDARDDAVLRVRGLVVEDAEGRERILIGAPLPDAESRIRTDLERAKAAWGAGFPDMDWYERLDHSSDGILILDANGHDRIAIGVPTPDPNTGQRIAPGVGIQINDEQGYERSGWGHMPGIDQVAFGLDHKGGEGLNLFLLEDGTAGMYVRDESGGTFVGLARPDGPVPGLERKLNGVAVHDAAGLRLLVDGTAEPEVETRATDGTRERFPTR